MARTVEQIQAELDKVTAQNKANYDALKAQPTSSGRTFNPGGLEYQYNAAVNSGDTAAANKLKPQYEATVKAYKESQDKKNALTKELEAAKKTAATEKVSSAKAKAAESVYDKALKDLEKAQTQLGLDAYKGTESYVAAYQAAQQAFTNAQNAGVKNPKPLPAQEVPVPPSKTETTGGGAGSTLPQPEVLDLASIFGTLADPANKQLLIDYQKDLIKKWGYTGKADGKYSLPFQAFLGDIANKRAQLPTSLQGTDFRTFVSSQDKSLFSGTTGTGTAGAKYQPTANIYSENEAADVVQTAISSLLKRDATQEELKNFSKKLIAAQSDPKNAVRQTLNKKTGILETTGGINATQFIENLVRGTDEYKGLLQKAESKKQTALNVAKSGLQDTILANGLDATMFKDLDAWAQKIADGEDPSYYKGLIRQTAKMGMPDNVAKLLDQGVDLETIYAPYKTLMQNTLEIPAGQLNLNDPTLRSAIGAEKPMTIYDFQNSLRKDSRWQFTSNAKSTVNGAVQKVLQDFGFMG